MVYCFPFGDVNVSVATIDALFGMSRRVRRGFAVPFRSERVGFFCLLRPGISRPYGSNTMLVTG